MSERWQKILTALYVILLVATWVYLSIARRRWLYDRPYQYYEDCEFYLAAGFALVPAILFYFIESKGDRELLISLGVFAISAVILYGFFWLTRISITLVP